MALAISILRLNLQHVNPEIHQVLNLKPHQFVKTKLVQLTWDLIIRRDPTIGWVTLRRVMLKKNNCKKFKLVQEHCYMTCSGCQGPTTSPTTNPSAITSKKPSKNPSDEPSNLSSRYPTRPCLDKKNKIDIGWYDIEQEGGTDYGMKTCRWLATVVSTKVKTLSCQRYDIKDYCFMTCTCEGLTYEPTPLETNFPSMSPTTDRPTTSPSYNPSNAPTTSPSNKPTASPIYNPSIAPTTSPSNKPTASPIYNPSIAPTTLSSSNPTQACFDKGGTVVLGWLETISGLTNYHSKTCKWIANANFELRILSCQIDKIKNHCFGTCSGCEGPTYTPTPLPSMSPTLLSMDIPSIPPTTSTPTTKEPTIKPSEESSDKPSEEPTKNPSISLSLSPSKQPTQECLNKNGKIYFDRYTKSNGDWKVVKKKKSCGWLSKTTDEIRTFACQERNIQSHCYLTCTGCVSRITNNPTELFSTSPSKRPSVSRVTFPSFDPTVTPSFDPTITPSFGPTITQSFDLTVTPSFNSAITPTVNPPFTSVIDSTKKPSVAPIDTTKKPSVAPIEMSMSMSMPMSLFFL